MNERTSPLPLRVACSDPECQRIRAILAPLDPHPVFWCDHDQEEQPLSPEAAPLRVAC
jgi:hypothetical protein